MALTSAFTTAKTISLDDGDKRLTAIKQTTHGCILGTLHTWSDMHWKDHWTTGLQNEGKKDTRSQGHTTKYANAA